MIVLCIWKAQFDCSTICVQWNPSNPISCNDGFYASKIAFKICIINYDEGITAREACLEVHSLAGWLSGFANTYWGREKVVKRISSLGCDHKEDTVMLRLDNLWIRTKILLGHCRTEGILLVHLAPVPAPSRSPLFRTRYKKKYIGQLTAEAAVNLVHESASRSVAGIKIHTPRWAYSRGLVGEATADVAEIALNKSLKWSGRWRRKDLGSKIVSMIKLWFVVGKGSREDLGFEDHVNDFND
jgi:hypothetical protein